MSYNYLAPPESYFATRLDEENDLDRCMNESPHVVTFWNAVCAYINHEREHGEDPDRVLECPSWGQWRSIGQHLDADKKVEAIKLLRASTYAWTSIPAALPPYITNEGWRAFMAANALPAWDRRGGLSLSEAESIIDTLETAPHWFGRDTNREFNSPYVTCAEPVPGGHVPQEPTLKFGFGTLGVPRDDAPKSLGELLLEKIAAMREEPPSEDPEKPEHSLWLNVYPDEPGYTRVAANGSRGGGPLRAGQPHRLHQHHVQGRRGTMNNHIFSLVTRATVAISKQAGMPAESEEYAQATQDASDILAHLCVYAEVLEACVNQIHLATIRAQVSTDYPIKTLDQILET